VAKPTLKHQKPNENSFETFGFWCFKVGLATQTVRPLDTTCSSSQISGASLILGVKISQQPWPFESPAALLWV
jgi:hypothetical protein